MYGNKHKASFIRKNHGTSLSTHEELGKVFREPWCPEPGMKALEELGGPQM